MRTDDKTLIDALEILSREIQSDDGIANACIREAAQRLRELTEVNPYSAGQISDRQLAIYNLVKPVNNDLDQTQWRTMDTAPKNELLLLYCPYRHPTNVERIEIGFASTSRGTNHSWATLWMPLPNPPKKESE